VLEQLLSDLHGIPTVVLVKMIRLHPWQKFSCKTGTALTIKEQENLVNGLSVKIPMFLLSKPTFITMRVEDLDKKFAL
jgi:DNA mismatch repair protein MutL